MSSEVIVALLSCFGTIIGAFAGVMASSKLTNYRLQQLEDKVNEHNQYAKRMPVIEEQIKVINHRISDLERKEAYAFSLQSLEDKKA